MLETEIIKMKKIYENSNTSAELAGVEQDIQKALLKIYKSYKKIAGRENGVYLNMSISTSDDGEIILSANNAYFEDGSFDSETPLRMFVEYEK